MAKSPKLSAALIHQFCDLAHTDRHLPQLKQLLAEYPQLLTAARPGKDPETALGAAIHSRAAKTIRYLVGQGCEADVFVAGALQDYAQVEQQLKSSPRLVNTRAKHIHNMNLMDLAADERMVRLLLKSGYPLTIHLAAEKGLLDEVQRFLKRDSKSLHSLGPEGQTPLFNAIWGARDEVALYLLEQGCDPDWESRETARPMTYACIWGRSKPARALLDAGIDIGFIGLYHRFSYLHTCANWGDEPMGPLTSARYEQEARKIIRWLFHAGIDPAIRDKRRKTAEQVAREKGFVQRADLICKLAN